MKRYILLVGSLLLSAVAGSGAHADAANSELKTTPALYQSVQRERLLDGIVEAVNRSTVSAQTSGKVTEISFDVDDFVPAGSVLLRFEDTEQRARLRQAEADRQSAEARLAETTAQFARIEKLFQTNTASLADLERARANRDDSRARFESTKAALTRAQEQLEHTVVRAPYSGVVTERHIELGESAAPGRPLMSGFSLDFLRVRVDVPQRLIDTVRRENSARVILPGPNAASVQVDEIRFFPYANVGSNTIPVRLSLPDAVPSLFPGTMVKVAFAMGHRLRLAIPESAVVYRSEVVGVYTVDENKRISFRHIRSGHLTADGTIEVLSGLEEGEHVALDPVKAVAQLKAAPDSPNGG